MPIYFQIFITLLSLLNPILALSQYLNMTNGMSKEAKRSIAIVCGLSVFGILGGFLFLGTYIMEGLSIHEYSLRLGGGIILLILGIKIILGDDVAHDRSGIDKPFEVKNVKAMGVSPLALPMIVGPASIVLVIVYSQDAPNLISKFIILLILALLAAIIAVTFILADYIAKAVGEVGIVVITKIMGLVVTAIAFEMIIAGLQTVMPMILKGSS